MIGPVTSRLHLILMEARFNWRRARLCGTDDEEYARREEYANAIRALDVELRGPRFRRDRVAPVPALIRKQAG